MKKVKQRQEKQTSSRDRPTTIYKITEAGEISETTVEEAMKEIHEKREDLLAKLADCIDNEKPFLLITCTTEELHVENLRVTSSGALRSMSKLLSPIFLGVPYPSAKAIVSELSDLVFLKMIDEYVRNVTKDYVNTQLLNLTVSRPIKGYRLQG